jgi:hypothetical protein
MPTGESPRTAILYTTWSPLQNHPKCKQQQANLPTPKGQNQQVNLTQTLYNLFVFAGALQNESSHKQLSISHDHHTLYYLFAFAGAIQNASNNKPIPEDPKATNNS